MCQSILRWLSVLVSVLSVSCNDSPTIRQTTYGPIEGLERTSSLGQKYYSFLGIPFAEPPITGIDLHTGEEVDRRFKVRPIHIFYAILIHK